MGPHRDRPLQDITPFNNTACHRPWRSALRFAAGRCSQPLNPVSVS